MLVKFILKMLYANTFLKADAQRGRVPTDYLLSERVLVLPKAWLQQTE